MKAGVNEMISAFLCLAVMNGHLDSVTLKTPAVPLAKVLAEISSQTGVPHRITGPSHLQFVYMKVDNLSAERTRDALAKVTRGSWKLINGSWHLSRTDPATIKDQLYIRKITEWRDKIKISDALDAAGIEAALEESVVLQKRAETDSTAYFKLEKLESQVPEVRLFQRLIKSLDLKHLTSIKDGERIVFAIKPTTLQHAADKSSPDFLAQFWKEQQLHIEVLEKTYPKELRSSWPGSEVENPLIDNFAWIGTNRPPAEFHLAAARNGDLLSFDLCVYDDQGEVHFRYTPNSGVDLETFVSAMAERDTISEALTALNQPLHLDEVDESLLGKFTYMLVPKFAEVYGVKLSSITEEETDILLRSNTEDLLSRWPSKILDQLAETTGKQVIAVMSDEALLKPYLTAKISGKATLGQAIGHSFGFSGRSAEGYSESADLITITPSDSSLTDYSHYIRSHSAELFRAIYNQQDVIGKLANLAAASESTNQIMFPRLAAEVMGDTTVSDSDDYKFGMLKFFGQLSAEERRMAQEKTISISLKAAPPRILSALTELVLHSKANPFHLRSPEALPSFNETIETRSTFEREPTVWFSLEALADSYLTLSVKEEEKILFRSQKNVFSADYGNVSQILAGQQLSGSNNTDELQGFYNGSYTELRLKLVFQSKKSVAWRTHFYSVSTKGKKMGLDELPGELKEKIRSMTESKLEWMKKNQNSDGSTGTKAPPLN